MLEQIMNKKPTKAERRAREQQILDELEGLPPGLGGVDEGFDDTEAAIDQPWCVRHEGAE